MIAQLLEKKFQAWLLEDISHTSDKFIDLCAEEYQTTAYYIEKILERCDWFTSHTPLFSIAMIEAIVPAALDIGKYSGGRYVPGTIADGTKINITGVPDGYGLDGIYYAKRRSTGSIYLFQDAELTIPVNREGQELLGPLVDYSGGIVEVIYE